MTPPKLHICFLGSASIWPWVKPMGSHLGAGECTSGWIESDVLSGGTIWVLTHSHFAAPPPTVIKDLFWGGIPLPPLSYTFCWGGGRLPFEHHGGDGHCLQL